MLLLVDNPRLPPVAPTRDDVVARPAGRPGRARVSRALLAAAGAAAVAAGCASHLTRPAPAPAAAVAGQCGVEPGVCLLGAPAPLDEDGEASGWRCLGLHGGADAACALPAAAPQLANAERPAARAGTARPAAASRGAGAEPPAPLRAERAESAVRPPAAAQDAAARPAAVSPRARAEIAALLAAKAQRTPAQQKVGSQLLDAAARARQTAADGGGLPLGPRGAAPDERAPDPAARLNGRAPVDAGSMLDDRAPVDLGAAADDPAPVDAGAAADGRVAVDIRAEVTPEVLARIGTLGGAVVNSVARYRAIRARLPLAAVEPLAEIDAVRSIRFADEAATHQAPGVRSADRRAPASPARRKVDTSEGDVAHRADRARLTYGIDGTGIGIGVVSNGVDDLALLQRTGDLPGRVTVLARQAGVGTEGTAMLEIVHDLAPGADLYYATAQGGEAQYAANIEALCAAGADVIVDDIFYHLEPVFQDGVIAQGINAAVAGGCFHFSSAGNAGNLNDGTSGVWEGDYAAGGALTVNGEAAGVLHDFGGGLHENPITKYPGGIVLQWADPLGASANDYDLFLIDAGGNVIASSTTTQSGSQDPIEYISGVWYQPDARLVVVKAAGADRYLRVSAIRGELEIATAGNTFGHSAAANAIGVAAVDVGTAKVVFDGTESVRTYSSDGPRRIFFQPDGAPITADDFSSTGGTALQKPDLAAADGVSTRTPGFRTFSGTSAAAPHAAAIAALLLEAAGGADGMTLDELRAALAASALDIEAAGVDRDSGAGIVMAPVAAEAVAVAPADRNRAPAAAGTLADRTLAPGAGAVTIDLATRFADPDGDPLTWTALSSHPDRAPAALTGSLLRLTPVAPSRAVVTVRATDPDGLAGVGPAPPPARPAALRALESWGELLLLPDAVTVDIAGAFSDAGGDALTYAASSSAPGVVTVSVSGSVLTLTPRGGGEARITVTATDAGGSTQSFEIRVRAGGAVDYDADDDGLIEISTLAQLDAVRHDLDGDGAPPEGAAPAERAAAATYGAAFADALLGMGCPLAGCTGYELVADLDFDTDGDGVAGGGDRWWNAGAGWEPIGTRAQPFAATFDGNGRTISGLFIEGGGSYRGLFGTTAGWSLIRYVGVTGADVRAGGSRVGILVGLNRGTIRGSYVTGRVAASNHVGGLAGANHGGVITGSYATAEVSGRGDSSGSLVGFTLAGAIRASYATGRVSGESGVGGLLGTNQDGKVSASYATGRVTGARGAGGLVGNPAGGVVTAGYWDAETSDRATGSAGSGLSTAALQAPAGYTGPYETWNVDVDGDGAADDPWHFGTGAQYPVLSVDIDGDGQATWQEFGHQVRAGPAVAASSPGGGAPVHLTWTAVDASHWTPPPRVTYAVYRTAGGTVERLASGLDVPAQSDTTVPAGVAPTYQVAVEVSGGEATRSAWAPVRTPPPNRGPEAVGALSAVTLLIADGAVTVDVSGAFLDPDGDPLTYAASSSAPGVATVEMATTGGAAAARGPSGSTVTVTPLAAGETTVTATDTGGSGGTATQSFRVTVPEEEEAEEEEQAEDARPNVVLIMADDVGYEAFGAYGNRHYSTPRIDRLADEGVRFTHAYSHPACTPSRVALMTGKSNVRNYADFGVLVPGQYTIADLFEEAGYATAIAGKWQLHGSSTVAGVPAGSGFDTYCLWQTANTGDSRYWGPSIECDGEIIASTADDYGPDMFTDFLLEFIESNRDGPFFAYYPMVLPHAPFVPPPQSSCPGETYQCHYEEMVGRLDYNVGRIHDKLAELELLDTTLVFFTSDNGTPRHVASWFEEELIYGDKRVPTDGGTRVPLIVRGPGSGGRVLDDLVDFTDFLPTLADAAGVTLPEDDPLDGVSFWDRLQGREGRPREWIHTYYFSDPYVLEFDTPSRTHEISYARDRRYKLYGTGELFDVSADRHEVHPLPGGDEESRAARARLQAALDSMPARGREIRWSQVTASVSTSDPFLRWRPVLSRATVNGAELTLAYAGVLNTDVAPPVRSFGVSVDGAEREVVAVSMSAGAVTLTLGAAVTAGQTVTVSYNPAGSRSIAHANRQGGNRAAPLFREAVTNETRNRPPVPVGTLAHVMLPVGGGAAAVDAAVAFRDEEGDTLTWAAVSSSPEVATVSVSGSVLTLTPLAAGETTVTVTATDAGGSGGTAAQSFRVTVPEEDVDVDYDADDDGLIEIVTLAQLDAVRHDRDGDGVPAGSGASAAPGAAAPGTAASGAAAHAAAFPDAAEGMGCPAPACLGYELAGDLDFDTDGSGAADAGDAFWNGGAGWPPLGTFDEPFAAVFSGNGRTVSHLFVGGGDNAGLFGMSSGVIRGVGVVAADVTGSQCAGALAGLNGGRVEASWSTGAVTGDSCVGGLVGVNGLWVPQGGTFRPLEGVVAASWSAAETTAEQWVGGLVGYNNGTVVASYATGPVSATTEGSGGGGLVGRMGFGGNRITASYATGAVSGPGGAVGGLVGHAMPHDRVEVSYWDTETSGVTRGGGGAGRTTAALQEPTGYAGPYASWDVDVDGDGGPDAPWDFGTSSAYPALSVDADGDGVATWRELGAQGRAVPPPAASGAGVASGGAAARAQADGATARAQAGQATFTDDPLVPGVTPVRAVHLLELRSRIDGLRVRAGLPAFGWTDAKVVPGVTPARALHLTELRSALGEAYAAAGRSAPGYMDARVTAGATAMRALQLQELRTAVLALEGGP